MSGIRITRLVALAMGWMITCELQAWQNDTGGTTVAPPKSINTIRAEGLEALRSGDQQAALAAADQLVDLQPNNPRTMQIAADIYLRTGAVERATKWFNSAVKAQPRDMPFLWQRGISLYFSGDFDEAAKQFEEHRKVNPNDVENAAWHFLCVAKAKTAAEAKELLLPAPNDGRIPMKEVLEMFSSGDTSKVVSAMEAVQPGDDQFGTAAFYGHFYLGLYADALGDQATARKHLQESAKDAPHHYMGDVARVYAKHLSKDQNENSK